MQAVVLSFCVDPSRCLSVVRCARVSEEQQRVLGPRDLLLAALQTFGLTWRDSEGLPSVLGPSLCALNVSNGQYFSYLDLTNKLPPLSFVQF